MWVGVLQGLGMVAQHWAWLGLVSSLAGTVCLLGFHMQSNAVERRREMRVREELEAYARLDTRLPADGDGSELGRRVCRVVAGMSAFHRVAMLMRDAEANFYVVGSAGMDEQTIRALAEWGEDTVAAERGGTPGCRRGDGGLGMRVGEKSFAVVLAKKLIEVGCGRAIVVPLWTTGGRMVGALTVCADGLMSMRRGAATQALAPLEDLAAKLGRSIENAVLAERLLRAEKLAELGLVASDVAHALNNPLTAVLGFAELIAHTTSEPRVQADAETIVREARRIRQTVESLVNHWQPIAPNDEPVDVVAMLRELQTACAEKLDGRGILLIVQAEEDVPTVRGNREILRQVMEHLLNNAAQAIGAAQELGVESPLGDGEAQQQHAIRVSISHDGRRLHLVVSDTGPGFREPRRVFDPLHSDVDLHYRTLPGYRIPNHGIPGYGTPDHAPPNHGPSRSLQLCHGVIRELGGTISACNLRPHGASVMVELPLDAVVTVHNPHPAVQTAA